MTPPPPEPRRPRHPALADTIRFACATALTGIIAGLVGLACIHILHSLTALVWDAHSATLLEAVEAAPWWKRVAVLAASGAIGGISWTLLFRSDKDVVSVARCVQGEAMPVVRALWHALTQIGVVALGASVGREVAPREVAASLSAWMGDRLGLSPRDRRIIVACGAGAGLAAVYSIPLSGAVYTLEILLVGMSARACAAALAASGIAVLVSTGWARPEPFYTVPDLFPSLSLTVWAAVFGAVIGWLGWAFKGAVAAASGARPRGARLLWTLPVAFTAVGALSVWVPSVLGNGQASAQTQFDAAWAGGAGLAVAALVLAAKAVATLVTIRAGAWGGVLTPAVALGAGLGALSGLAWSQAWPGSPVAAHVFIGAAVFLGASMDAPFTGLVLVAEFTQQGAGILVPAIVATASATAASALARALRSGRGPGRGPR